MDKLIYEFPPRLSRSEKQAKALHDLQEHQKFRRQMYKNLILAGVIFALSLLVKPVLIKILLILIAAGNAAVGALIYRFYSLSRDTSLYTRIYDNRLEHCQRVGLTGDKLHITLYYSDISSSRQDNRGRLIVSLGTQEKSFCERETKQGDKKGEDMGSTITLRFADTPSKLTLIEKMHEQIKYPKKQYNVISDEDDYYSDEDMKWDSLHKHGL